MPSAQLDWDSILIHHDIIDISKRRWHMQLR
jgi:hypothetical protein